MMAFYWIYFGVISFVLGSILASAMTCLGDRLALGKSWAKGRSHCDVCEHTLEWKDLIPIVSYCSTKGHCRYCGAKLSPKYLVTEILLGVLFLLCFLKQGMINLTLIEEWGFLCALLAISITDLDSYVIPDRLVVFLVIWKLAFSLINVINGTSNMREIWQSLLAGGILAGFVLVIALVMEKAIKKEAMGGGDIKLLFALGLYTGLVGGFLMLVLACIIGLVVIAAMKKKKIPFGPSLSLAAVLVLLFGDGLVTWYLGLLGI